MAVLASHPAPTHSQLQPMHIALYIYIHYTYYIIFITYVFESLLFWHLNLMCFFFYIYLSTDNVQPIINQTMQLKDGKILICCHGKGSGEGSARTSGRLW